MAISETNYRPHGAGIAGRILELITNNPSPDAPWTPSTLVEALGLDNTVTVRSSLRNLCKNGCIERVPLHYVVKAAQESNVALPQPTDKEPSCQ